MRRISTLTASIVLSISASGQAQAQTIHHYGYDALGRLTQSGANSSTTNVFVLDDAGNRKAVRCCHAIGGAQVLDDGFDPYFYLQTYPDIQQAGIDPYQHWLTYGHVENRWPNRYFNTAWYRTTYGLSSSTNPLSDYHNGGWSLGRHPSPEFSTTQYHAHYADTASIDPLQHYLRWGYGEGRQAFPL